MSSTTNTNPGNFANRPTEEVKEIAAILKVSAKTVEFHKSALMERLDIHTTAELTRYAIGHGLVAM